MTKLGMKCLKCGCWNRFEVEKIMFNAVSSEPSVQVYLPSYLPLKIETCQKCNSIIAEPTTIIRITKAERAKA